MAAARPPPVDELSRVEAARARATHEGAAHTADDGAAGAVFGIDVGTTHTVIALAQPGRVSCIPLDGDAMLLPSVVAYHATGEIQVGRAACAAAADEAQGVATVARELKRIIGKQADDVRVREDQARWNVHIVADTSGGAVLDVPAKSGHGARTAAPAAVAATVLARAREAVKEHTGYALTRAVVTVPCHFDVAQCDATRDACAAAGIAVQRLLPEPEAAAHAVLAAPSTGLAAGSPLVVFDWGGGTCDVAIVAHSGAIVPTAASTKVTGATLQLGSAAHVTAAGEARVLATAGDSALGGMDMDLALLHAAATKLCAQYAGADQAPVRAAIHATLRDAGARDRALQAVRDVRERLSTLPRVTARVPHWPPLEVAPADVAYSVRALLHRARVVLYTALDHAGLSPDVACRVALVGGVTRMPCVRSMLRAALPNATALETAFAPDFIVAQGAALVAARDAGTFAGTLTAFPAAAAAAARVSIPIGVAAANGTVHPLVPAGAPVGAAVRATQLSTRFNAQSSVSIRLVRGFHPLASACDAVGNIVIRFAARLPAGVHHITLGATPMRDGSLQVVARSSVDDRMVSATFADAVLCDLPESQLQPLRAAAEAARRAHQGNLERERLCSKLENSIATVRRTVLEPGVLPEDCHATMQVRLQLDSAVQHAERQLAAFRKQGAAADTNRIADAQATLQDVATKAFRRHVLSDSEPR